MSSAQVVATIQSVLVGDNKGNQFNDLQTVIGIPATVTINTFNPLKSITVMHGSVVDGIEISYFKGESGDDSTDVSHGTSSKSKDTALTRTTIDLEQGENIIAVSGVSGISSWGLRVLQLNFVIYNSKDGKVRVQGPFGKAEGESLQPFHVTANGILIALGGFAINTNSSLGQLGPDKAGGLYGLTFFDVAHRAT
ncbi:hypothetical protein EST38_g5838 [Candolleomyces aberdarensis]|uniref:Jacalin-type lectin domain-containing protein n=1 Tax=Candolleomyces aberdarensis TaxID=2316362 RepID=A0A4Q2DM62_9AGAR|nr:hypothetical protein EST38_g5838 [Candolleomyces aberdarensis]